MKTAYAVSKQQDTKAAARDVVEQCLWRLGSASDCTAGMLFAGADYDPQQLASTIHALLPSAPIIGCSTDGEITTGGLSEDSVCLILFSSEKVCARVAAVPNLSADSYESGLAIAKQLHCQNGRALILLPDGLTGNGSAILRGALDALGPQFVVAGGTAGDRGRFRKTWQFCNGEAYSDAVVGLMLLSDGPIEIGYGVMSGWRPMGIAKEVTEAVGNTVFRIEDETAMDVYSRFLGDKASQLPQIGVEYPFALVDSYGRVDTQGIREDEEYLLLRAPMAVDRERGAVTFAAEIPQGAKIKMTRAKSGDVIEGAREAAKRAQERLSGEPDVVFFFSCMARKVVLGRKTSQEIAAAQGVFGKEVPMIGFYTYGEFANCGTKYPVCRFHNETATFLAIREG